MKAFLISIAALCACLALPAHAVVLELRDHQTVLGENITLNDLVASTQDVSSDDLSAVITASPSLGNQQTFTREDIEKALPASLRQQVVAWTGATACVVSRPAVQYTPHEVRELITSELGRHLPADSDFAILEIPDLNSFLVPTGPIDAQVELGQGALRNEWGDATLRFSSEGQTVVTQNVRFHWAYTRKVWQVANHVASKAELDASSFQQIQVNVLRLPGELAPATDFPDGKVAAHDLPEGKILMENDWVEPVLVVRNDLVTVSYDHHGISITVQGRAMSDGSRDQVIAVQNLTSHKIFNARVVNQRSLVYDE
jgi:flagella basal body P-ring formation protein FlgA